MENNIITVETILQLAKQLNLNYDYDLGNQEITLYTIDYPYSNCIIYYFDINGKIIDIYSC